jgi:hypothetical protein
LVHGIDTGEVDYAEEENARTEGDTAIALTGSIDLLLGYARILDSLVDLFSKLLTVLQLVYQSLV